MPSFDESAIAPTDMLLFHGSMTPISKIEPGIHLGTFDQARMRGSHIYRFAVGTCRFKRLVDRGRHRWDWRALRRAELQGYDGIVYLNRFEGIPLDEFRQAQARVRDIDALSDSRFMRLLPSACDSWIILDPHRLRLLGCRSSPDIRSAA